MAISTALFSSRSEEWETPNGFFKELDREFHFTLDACATAENAKVKANYITKEIDALRVPWTGVVWCNPPYGRDIGLWFRKVRIEAEAGSTVVMLAPARTDTRWWHDNVQGIASEVRFVRGRLKFQGGESKGAKAVASQSAPFPSAVIIYRPKAS